MSRAHIWKYCTSECRAPDCELAALRADLAGYLEGK